MAYSACTLYMYNHNVAQNGKDVCDAHFLHQLQMHVDNYSVQGEGGRKASTPKQLAVAWMENRLLNTTIFLVELDFKTPYRFAVVLTS